METDLYYIERCLDGHPDDFCHLVGRYQPVLLAYLAGRLGRRDRAEEAAQETFVRAYFKMGNLREPAKFLAWLLAIADRVAGELRRREQVRRRYEAAYALNEEALAPGSAQDHDLERAVAGLPDPYRQAILLRYYGGSSCTQIAERLDTPVGTVTKTLSRAYALLREALQHGCETEEVQP